MNAERLEMLLNNYAAHLPAQGVPERVQTLWQAAERCAAAFDPAADSAQALHAALSAGAPAFAASGCAQPLNGLLFLAEKEPEMLRDALLQLLTADGGDLALRQARMQAFCERCNEKLLLYPEIKRTWSQSIRAAMTLVALLRPAQNFIYKSNEARYVADMTGCTADVSSGALFSLAGFHELAEGLAQAVDAHPVLSLRIPADGPLPAAALRNLMVADVLLNAGVKKLALFGDAEPLIVTRSRTGQAAQERAVQLKVLELQLQQLEETLARLRQELDALPVHELTGQRFSSAAFGEVVCTQVQGNIITLETGGGPRRMSLPECILQGHLVPQNAALAARYDAQSDLEKRQKALNADIINLQCAIRRLMTKP